SRRRHTRFSRDWSSDVCSSDLVSNRPADDLDVGAGADHLPPPSAGDGQEAAVRFSSGESPEEIGTLVGVEIDDGDEVVAGAAGEIGRASWRERRGGAAVGGAGA